MLLFASLLFGKDCKGVTVSGHRGVRQTAVIIDKQSELLTLEINEK